MAKPQVIAEQDHIIGSSNKHALLSEYKGKTVPVVNEILKRWVEMDSKGNYLIKDVQLQQIVMRGMWFFNKHISHLMI